MGKSISAAFAAIVFMVVAANAHAGATPHMTPLRSGLVSLSSGQTMRLNVMLNPSLVGAREAVTIALSFDAYDIVPIDGGAVTRPRSQTSTQVTLRGGE